MRPWESPWDMLRKSCSVCGGESDMGDMPSAVSGTCAKGTGDERRALPGREAAQVEGSSPPAEEGVCGAGR